MAYTRFTKEEWTTFFHRVDIVVGFGVGLAVGICIRSFLWGVLWLFLAGLVLPRFARQTAVRFLLRKGPFYRRDDYVISAAITGWVCSFILIGIWVWLLCH